MKSQHDLLKLTWSEAAEWVKKDPVVMVPIGSTECEGPHLPLGSDYLVSNHVAQVVAAQTDSLVAPGVPYGMSAGFIDFASPGIDEAAMRLAAKGVSHIVATGVPALLHSHPLSVVSPQMAADWLRETVPYADVVYVKPDPGPVAGMLAARLVSKVLDALKVERRMRLDHKRSATF